MDILDNGRFGLRPGKTNDPVFASASFSIIASARAESGTRWIRAPFIREADQSRLFVQDRFQPIARRGTHLIARPSGW